MAIGLKLNSGGNITGFSAPVAPDRGFTKETKPIVLRSKFGDGYEQRKVKGINNLDESYNLSFSNRPNTETDDLEAFFISTGGVTKFIFTIPDSNEGTGEKDIKVVCDEWSKSHTQTSATSLTAKIRRVYEA
tara:strand:- start:929 stop:1324 length:396 start_codon:yes stop_codon:yes gene_type:complete